ncbi:MAG: hypothetical protein PHH00_01685 [Candidatus Nanoarchaeia archaeon]|nr:hypothetical protein [Candidatus Nanoarchaeia archaeon]
MQTETTEQERWMNQQEIRELGRGRWSDLELAEILDYGVHPLPSRQQEGVTEYLVDNSSLSTFLPYQA